jgi:hypothetical protein
MSNNKIYRRKQGIHPVFHLLLPGHFSVRITPKKQFDKKMLDEFQKYVKV